MGPRPLPVEVVKGSGAAGGKPKDKEQNVPRGQLWTKRLNSVGNFARGAGQVGSAIAKNKTGELLTTSANGAAKALALLGPEGMVAGAALGAVVSGVTAFSDTVDAFVERGRQLQGYSSDLAAANAKADVSRTMMDMKEANQLGPALAQLTAASARSEAFFQDIWIQVKEPLITVCAAILECIPEFLKILLDFLNTCTFFIGDNDINGIKASIDKMWKRAGDNQMKFDPVGAWLEGGRTLSNTTPNTSGVGSPIPAMEN